MSKCLFTGRIVEVDEHATRLLSIVYRIYTALLCLTVAVTFAVFGSMLLKSLNKMHKNARIKSTTENRMASLRGKVIHPRFHLSSSMLSL